MHHFYQETLSQLVERWTVLSNEVNRYGADACPDMLCVEVLHFIREVERLILPDPFEQDILITARHLAEQGDPKIAMFKVDEVLRGRLV
jgi:hypothetical protein